MYDALRCQDYLFAVLTRGNCFHSARVIGSMFDYIYAPDNHQICINRLAHPSTRIVSLTITEKGYCEVSKIVVEDRRFFFGSPYHPKNIYQDLN